MSASTETAVESVLEDDEPDDASEALPDADDAAPAWRIAASLLEAADVEVAVEAPAWMIAASLLEAVDVEVAVEEEATASCVDPSAVLPPPHPAINVLIVRAIPEAPIARNILNRIDKSRKGEKSGVSTFSARSDGSRRITSLFGTEAGGVEFKKPEKEAPFL